MIVSDRKRSRNILRNISSNALYKIIGMSINYLTMPLVVKYLNTEKYGIWVTIMSILAWSNMLDIGIGNGLRNKVAENFAKDDYEECNRYIATGYISLSVLLLLALFILLLLIPNLNWEIIFNTEILSNEYLIRLMMITTFLYMLNFALSLVNSLYYAVQKASVPAKRLVYSNILYFILLVIFSKYVSSSLIMLSTIYQLSSLLSNIILSVTFFKEYKELTFKYSYFTSKKVKSILNVGIKFLVLQVASIIIFTTDNIIITSTLGPKEVTAYSIVLQIFNIIGTIYTIILTPLWSAYTEAYTANDIKWIKNTIKKLNLTIIGVIMVDIILLYLFDIIINIWMGKGTILIPELLPQLAGIYIIISCWNNIYAYFLNGVGVLNISLIASTIGAIVNIPLSIFFAKILGFGSPGVILATIISLLPSSILQPIQTKIILNKKSFQNKVMNKIINY